MRIILVYEKLWGYDSFVYEVIAIFDNDNDALSFVMKSKNKQIKMIEIKTNREINWDEIE